MSQLRLAADTHSLDDTQQPESADPGYQVQIYQPALTTISTITVYSVVYTRKILKRSLCSEDNVE